MVWVIINILDPYFMRARPATLMMKMEYGMFKCHDKASFNTNARETYQKHYEMVRRMIPKERLLEYELGSGWEPLCKFLGKRIPDESFPWKNESKEFAIWMRKTQFRVLREGIWRSGKTLGILGAVVLAAWAIVKSRKLS